MIKIFSQYLVIYLISYFAFVPPLYAQAGFGQPLGERRSLVGAEADQIESFGTKKGDVKTQVDSRDGLLESSIPPGGPGTVVSSLSYNVHVLGEVAKPGMYKVNPSDRLGEAVRYAGGILPDGSLRKIELRRGNETMVVDFSRYRQKGDLSQDPFLMDNDVVFIPLKQGEAEIEGPVNRPGVYELVGKTNLATLVKLAGGFSTGLSNKYPIRVIRYNPQEKKQVLPVPNDNESLKKFIVQKGDIVIVPHLLISDREFDYDINRLPGDNIFYPANDDNIYVIGAVALPGPYTFQPHYGYKQYVNQAGPLKDAKMKSIKIAKRNGKKVSASEKIVINPGDTVIVPQRYWKAEVVIGWLSTLSSLTLSSIYIYDNVKSN